MLLMKHFQGQSWILSLPARQTLSLWSKKKTLILFKLSSGYVRDLLVAKGKTYDPEKAAAYHVVMKLLQGLERKGYICVDNWYSSPVFSIDFAESGMWYCSRCQERLNRIYHEHQGQRNQVHEKEACVFKGRHTASTWKRASLLLVDNNHGHQQVFNSNMGSQRERKVGAQRRSDAKYYRLKKQIHGRGESS